MKNAIEKIFTLLVGLLVLLILTVGAYHLGAAWINWVTPDLHRSPGALHWIIVSWFAGAVLFLLAALVLALSYFIGKFLIEGQD